MKRKAESLEGSGPAGKAKRRVVNNHDQFREGLFDQLVLDGYTKSYRDSVPFLHGVIKNVISPTLLRSVRSEIRNLSFTPKETDIYRIHQSGDLANLDGLENASLKLLPSLLSLRDAMYSSDFREYLSHITGSGPLSGKKTDMAINVYMPGCHLLCHDDVIGSRRVSYILYLTDPDRPWKEEWGGALRLYPTQRHPEEDGEVTKVPSPDYSTSIPPAFNQLSFFAVQPGESFHDVEEVYSHTGAGSDGKDEVRVRMAISGWYHIPQEGEEGYEEGLEERLAEKSSLMQLQGKDDTYDLPRPDTRLYQATNGDGGMPTPSSQEDAVLSEEDCGFLLKYISPTYLTPDTLESVSSIFAEECSMCLETFLSRRFSQSIKDYIKSEESRTLSTQTTEIEKTTPWTVARPPHKHRFLFQRSSASSQENNPLQDLLSLLLPSKAFQKWLSLATGYEITSQDSLLRRFRRGQDYTLATGYEEDSPRIELCLGLTPTPGWDDQPVGAEDEVNEGTDTLSTDTPEQSDGAAAGVGGYLAYMAGDEDNDGPGDDAESDHGIGVPLDMSAGARSSRATKPKRVKQDPAVYQSNGDDEDDGVLFSMPAGWNRLGIVLRDKRTMRFVKYVSRMAKGDRWDLVGEFEIVDEEDEADNDEENIDTSTAGQRVRDDEDSNDDHDDVDDESDSTD